MRQSHTIVWTDYLKYRARLRGFDLAEIERILRFSEERYFDIATARHIVVGRQHGALVMIPYEIEGVVMRPVTIHPTSRQQVNLRVKSERFSYE